MFPPEFLEGLEELTDEDIDDMFDRAVTDFSGGLAKPKASKELSLREQRKRDGVCPECGDKTKERCVGVCADHGKFMG